jgi:hypothetical protein
MGLDREKMPAGAIYIDHPNGGAIVKGHRDKSIQMICEAVDADAAEVGDFLDKITIDHIVTMAELPKTISEILVFFEPAPDWHGWDSCMLFLLKYGKLRDIGHAADRAIELAIPSFINQRS